MKKQTWVRRLGAGLAGLALAAIVPAYVVSAERFTGTSWTIDASVGNSFGGSTSSTSYKMVSSGGEAIVGNGSGGSYKLTEGYVAQLEKSLQLTVQPNGLAAYYPMDEGIGTGVNDETANSNRGTALNNPTWVTGKIGSGMTFNGSNQNVQVPKAASINPTSALTISAWVRPANISSTAGQVLVATTETGGYALFITGSSTDVCAPNKLCFIFYSGTYKFVEVDRTALTNGQWAHITGTYDGTTSRLYINGSEAASQNNTGTISYHATAPLCLGSAAFITDCSQGSHFNGSLDEVKIFSRALTANEVSAEHAAGNTGVSAGLAFASNLTAGTPQNVDAQAVVQTDAPGYSLALNQNQNLTSGGNSISAITNGGNVTTPAAWVNGTTKGLGFTLTATNATALPGKWSSGAAYAAVPGSATTIYSRTGYTAGAKDTLSIRYRIDINTGQAAGAYANTITYTGTMTP